MPSVVKSVPITLDRERHLRLDLNAIVEFEQAAGISIIKIDFTALPMAHLRALLWACLLGEDPALTQQQVGEMIHVGNMAEMSEALGRVFGASAPEPDKSADPNGSPAPSTGSGSGASDDPSG
jgi:hypothetical protein